MDRVLTKQIVLDIIEFHQAEHILVLIYCFSLNVDLPLHQIQSCIITFALFLSSN